MMQQRWRVLIRAGATVLVLLVLGAGIGGCGETKAEEEAQARTTAQEEQAETRERKQEEKQSAEEERQEKHSAEEEARAPAPTKPTQEESGSSESSGAQDEVGSSSHTGDSQFCSEHECIGSFESEGGTVVECSDGSYSHAGGISGACSHHGGEKE
jgi:hypothetical protein